MRKFIISIFSIKVNFIALAVISLVLAGTAQVFADTNGTASKTLSITQFSELPENHGLHGRMLERKYEEYRHGRVRIETSNNG